MCVLNYRAGKYSMHERENALKEWLQGIIKNKEFSLIPLAGDASFRRYFRLQYNGLTQIVMDAPPGKEDLEPFIRIARTLAKANVLTPEILAIDNQQGFLLLSDFGDQLLLDKLQTKTADDYYHDAIKALFKIQQCPTKDLPSFDTEFMIKEMSICSEWFFNAYLSLELEEDEFLLIKKTMTWIAEELIQQPRVFIHRDYHSRNLMLVKNESYSALGVIDFQDAMLGPFTYDLVSLLKDCYISWPRERVIEWARYYYENNTIANQYKLSEFIRAFDICGIQRHLKVLGVFCRLYLRDSKSGYLKDLPLTLKYVLECSETYEELQPFYTFLQKRVFLP